MRLLKSLFPIIILLTGSYYGYRGYDQLPVSVIYGIAYIPHLLAIMVVGLSIHFNRSSIFFYVVLIVIAHAVLQFGLATTDLGYGLLSAFLPLLLLTLTILPDRGIISVRAIPAHAILLLTIAFSILLVRIEPAWAIQVLLTDWLPAQYFDWTGLP